MAQTREFRTAGNGTGGAASRVFSSNTAGHSAGGAAGRSTSGAVGKSVGGTTSSGTGGATANIASKEDPAPQESQRTTTVKKRVHDWKLTRPAKARAEICTKGWFKFTAARGSQTLPSALYACSQRRGSHARCSTENARLPPTLLTTSTVIGLATARDTAR